MWNLDWQCQKMTRSKFSPYSYRNYLVIFFMFTDLLTGWCLHGLNAVECNL